MSGPRFRFLSGAFSVLIVLGLLSANAAAAAPAGNAKAKTTAIRHRSALSGYKNASTLRRGQRRPHDKSHSQRAVGSEANDALSSETEALKVTPHFKKVKQHRPRHSAASGKAVRLMHETRAGVLNGPAVLAAPLDAQFPGLDENNDDADPLNYGDDFSADTDGAVGPKYYGEVVGSAYGFFDKATGALLDADTLQDLFDGTGVGAPCEAPNDDGFYEPHILYDSQSDRWIIMFSSSENPDTFTAVGPTDECIAVSASGDPVNGDWYFYNVPLIGAGALDVYGSAAGVWTDGIYFSEIIGCQDAATKCPGYNSNEELVGTQVWAFNRSDLESGAVLRVQTTQGVGGIGSGNFAGARTSTTFSNLDADGVVPANLETSTGVPPAGRNEYFMSTSDLPGNAPNDASDGLLDIWQYHVDWTTPANSWIGQSAGSQINYQVTTPAYAVPDDDISANTSNAGEITSDGPSAYVNTLDSDYDYILPKPQYTDFGGVESLWLAHATAVCSPVTTPICTNSKATEGPDQIRWQQISLNSSDGSPVTSGPTQSQDYAPSPTTLNRWLPAIGVDQDGDMAVGYSGTSSSVFPSLYIAGAAGVTSDAANTATISTIPEDEVYAGDGYQTGSIDGTAITNFGPENSMSLDPNGCEMWFAGQVDVGSPTQADGSDDAWATEISAFHFPGCTANTLATGLTTSGNASAASGTGTLTATLTETGTSSGVVGEVVDFTLGGTSVGTATTNSNGVATLSGVDTSAYAAGTYGTAVGASYGGDGTYNYGPSAATGSLLVGNTQTISFGSLAAQTYNSSPLTTFSVNASASSDLPVTFSASGDDGDGDGDSGTCSVSGTTVTVTSAGICTITASQPGDGATWLSAAPVSQTFDIAQETQTITVTGTWANSETIGTDFKATATSSSGGTVYFTADETNCTEVDNGDTPQDEFVPLAGPTCIIYAEQDGTTDFAQVILPVTVTITGTSTNTGTFAVTNASRRLDQLQATLDPVTWSSGLTSTSYTTSGVIEQGAIAAAKTSAIGDAGPAVIASGGIKDASTPATCTSPQGTATATTGTGSKGTAHGFAAGETVTIANVTPSSYDGTFVIKTVPSTTTFTYCVSSSSLGNSTGTGSAVGSLSITESGTTATVFVTTAPTPAFAAGQVVNIAGTSVAGYNNQNYTILASPAPTTTSFSVTATNGLGGAVGGTVGLAGTGASQAGGVATINLTAAPTVPLQNGATETIAGVSTAGYNITTTITVLSTTSFTYPLSTAVVASGSGVVGPAGVACTADTSVPGSETLTALHAGACTVTATQAGGGGVSSGTATITYLLTAGTQSVTWSPADGNISATNTTPVSATTNSGLSPGTVTSTTPSTCSTGGTTTTGGTSQVTVSPGTTGTCTLSAAGNAGSTGPDGVADWSALTAKTASFTVTNILADQLLEFAQLPDVTYGVAPFAVTATSVNAYYPAEVASGIPTGLAVSYAATGSCTVDGFGNVTITGAGTCTITASQGGNSAYNPAPSIANQFTVYQTASSIDFINPGTQTYGTPDFNPGATATSGEPVTYTAGPGGVCSIASNEVEIDGLGSCTVTAHSVGDVNNEPPANVSQTFNVDMATQTISFNVADHTYGDPDFTISATATSGLSVSFTYISGDCTLTGTTVHITSAGDCTIAADQGGDADYYAAPEVQDTFNIDEADQTITFPTIGEHNVGDADFDPGATASSGLPVSYAAGPGGVCSIASNEVEIDGDGQCTVIASQGGNADYNPASDVQQQFEIGSGAQTITFANPGTQTFGEADFDPGATASSGLPVSYGATGDCTITAGNLVHLTGGGSCTVAANQAGDADWDPATEVDQTFDINPADQTISFTNPGTQTYGEPDFSPGATASSDLAVSYSAIGNCSITAGEMVEIDGAGSCTVTASQAGDADYNAATDVQQAFTINMADQTISFSVADHTYGDPDFTISATATSGLTVSFTQISGDCTVTGDTVHITGAGNCTIAADQAGNANYNPAPEVQDTFNIDQADQSITFPVIPDHNYGDANFSPGATASSGLTVSYSASGACSINAYELVHLTGTGLCTVTAAQAGNNDYNPASDVQQSFHIDAGDQTITFPNPGTATYGQKSFLLTATASSGLTVSYMASGPCAIVDSDMVSITNSGSCTITASQAGNADYNAATEVQDSFTIQGMATHTKLAVTPAAQHHGGVVVLKATVVPSISGHVPTGQVSFYVNGVLVGTRAVSSHGKSKFNYTVSLSARRDAYLVHAVFTNSDGNYKGSTSTKKDLLVTS